MRPAPMERPLTDRPDSNPDGSPDGAVTHPDGRPERRTRRRRSRAGVSRQERIAGPLFISPFFIVFAAFGLFPMVFTFWVSLHDWSLLGDRSWVGLDNYRALLEDDHFWNALVNTLGIFVLATVPQILMALGLAQLLNSKLRARTFWRMGVLLPNITSVAAVGIIFTLLFAQAAYEQVAEAYIDGLEAFAARGGDPGRVASVASFFISRIDTLADALIQKKIQAGAAGAERARLEEIGRAHV